MGVNTSIPLCNEPVGKNIVFPTLGQLTVNNAMDHRVAVLAQNIKGIGRTELYHVNTNQNIGPASDRAVALPAAPPAVIGPLSSYAVPIPMNQVPPLSYDVKQTLQRYPQLAIQPEIRKQPVYLLIKSNAYYQGFWNNGVQHGKGSVQYPNGTYLYGQFENGVMKHCQGFSIVSDGSFYQGSIRDQRANGEGMFIFRRGEVIYEGQWLNNLPHGYGKETFQDGTVYEGNFVNGFKQGKGILKNTHGYVYNGNFHRGYPEGEGSQTMPTGQHYKGQFHLGQRDGSGVLQTKQGVYTGIFHQNVKHGEGTFEWHGGNRKFKGHFKDGLQQGFGQLSENSRTIEGIWQKGQNVKIDRISARE